MPSHPRNPHPDESDDLSLRAPRSAVSGIRKRYVRLVPIALVVVIAVALVIGLGINFHPSHVGGKHNIDLPPRDSRPADLSQLPDNYNQIPVPQPTPKPKSAPPDTQSATTSAKSATGAQDALRRQNAELRRNLASMMAAIKKIDTKNQQLLDAVNRYQDQAHKDQAKAWGSPVLIKMDDKHSTSVAKANSTPPPPENPEPQETPEVSKITHQGTDRVPVMSLPNTTGVSGNGNTSGGGISGGQRAFLRQSPAPKARLNEPYLYPLSPYEVQAGTVIPAALLTGINTDLPGEVIAVVTAPVYDSATGRHELIPQGAKLLGAYDSEIGNGQNRALLVWHRLIMPNGRSITLDHMPGIDAAGYAGVADRVDYHAGKLAVGTVLSSILAYTGNLARSPQSGAVGNTTSGSERDVIGDTVAQQAVRVGSKIIDRQLNVQPTITVRPGWPVRVLVNKDITLAPY